MGFEEKLLLETPSYPYDDNSVSWANLPRISISVKQSESVAKDVEFNILNITVESIYNVPSHFSEYMQFKCRTSLHNLDNVN